ncbi:MAG: histidine kinase dimerization/phospho-acceptor domain-containing protein [Cyanobacteriota/Melainabacteria group bacterium]
MKFTESIAFKVALMLCIPVFFELTVIGASMLLLGQIDKAREERRLVGEMMSAYTELMSHTIKEYAKFAGDIEKTDVRSRQQVNGYARETQRCIDRLRDTWIMAGFEIGEIEHSRITANRRISKPVRYFTYDLFKEQLQKRELLMNVLYSMEGAVRKRIAVLVEREAKEKELYWKMNLLLLGSLAASLLLTLGLSRAISRVILERLSVLQANIGLLAQNKELLPSLRGEDEIARLDANFHSMAESVQIARSRDRLILDNTLDIICALDGELIFRRVGSVCEKVWGVDEATLLGQPLSEVIAAEWQVETADKFDSARSSNTVAQFDNRTLGVGGDTIPSSWSVKWSEEEQLFICVVHDNRERLRAEEQRQELLAVVSHDLRSPLTTARLSLSSLLDEDTGLDADAQKNLTRVSHSIEHIIGVTNDLIDLMRVQQDRIDLYLKLTKVGPFTRLLDEYLDDHTVPHRFAMACRAEHYLTLDEEFVPRVILALARHIHLSCPDRVVEIGVGTSSSGESLSVHFRIEPAEALGEESLVFMPESDEARRISWEVSLALCKEIASRLKGDIATSWTASGSPVCELILPVIELDG